MFPVAWAACCVLPGRRVVGMRRRDAWGLPGLCPGAVRSGSSLEERPAEFSSWLCKWESWLCKWESSQWMEKLRRRCPLALACPYLPLVLPFAPSPIGRLNKRAGNVPVTAPLPPGTYAVSCWKARMSQGDSQTYFRPFLSLNACARQLYSEQQGPSKAAHTNVLYFEKVYSFNGDSFNWALPSLGAIKWHLLAPDWKAMVHAAPSYPAPAALLCITASHSDLTNLIHV